MNSNDRAHVVLIGRPTLKRWLAEAGIKSGPIFRRIDQWGNLDARALAQQSVNVILKSRCKHARRNPALSSAPGLRLWLPDRRFQLRHSLAGRDAEIALQVGERRRPVIIMTPSSRRALQQDKQRSPRDATPREATWEGQGY